MNEADELAQVLQRTVSGPMWHGPALAELLSDVSPSQAASRPIAGAHSIWELVLHIAVWADIARRRLEIGAAAEPGPHEDWPAAPAPDAKAWASAVERLSATYRALAAVARSLNSEQLEREVGSRGYSARTMLHGVIEHGTYHGGQIAILKRALESSP